MPQKFALKRLLEIAETTAESAAASLGALNRQLQQHEEKLLLLFRYRDEYQQRLRRAAGTAGLDGAGLRNFHEFLDRLEQAILQQHALVVEARTRVECGRTDWQQKQKKSKAFGTLAQRFDAAAQRTHASREQKLQDDFASRASRANHHARSHASVAAAKHRR